MFINLNQQYKQCLYYKIKYIKKETYIVNEKETNRKKFNKITNNPLFQFKNYNFTHLLHISDGKYF